ncbi:SDR family NAD(P)-dependent oxidoreductase [Nocardia huaxiensis]|uniref:SDR family NAD(P)-dependent oxidoreductase n=1 Tax=Nocardia huaxiensis TaxID=2755382 RepID=UPI001E50B80D|nr:SDR family NAD(P)-dependent oxidoreductase [Nocardia huaxiensis]UFS98521.1 SDR family NAD(P)-dependent oxidoreductase [Nocardia huaxiensis]
MIGLEGKVFAVTGAGNGLGREYALLLAREGARVVVNDLGGSRDGSGAGHSAADAVVEEITAAGGEAVANYDTVATEAGGAAIVQTALDTWGRIDGLVANAGILRDTSFHKMTTAQWQAVVDVHLGGTYHVIRAAWPHLREQGYGRIVVATSTSGLIGNFGQANYGAAKNGMVGLINTLAIEGRKFNIQVNAVAPLAATRMTEDVVPPDMFAAMPAEFVAPVVAQLLNEHCPDTGTVLVAGGGRVYRLQLFENEGVRFDGIPSVEDVAANWDRITGMKDAVPAANPAVTVVK